MSDTPVIVISELWANAALFAIIVAYAVNAALEIWLNAERRKYRKAVKRAESMFENKEAKNDT